MKSTAKFTFIALAVLMSLVACSTFEANTGNRSHSTNTSKSTFTDKTENKVIEIEIKPDMRTHILKINNIKLEKGEITWRLIAPEDEMLIREEILIAPEKYDERFDLEIIPGLWKLELEMYDASGSYNIHWEAKN